MTKLKVEVMEKGGFMDGAVKRECGDIFTSENGGEYVRLGWCKSVGTGEQGERKPGAQSIEVQNLITRLK